MGRSLSAFACGLVRGSSGAWPWLNVGNDSMGNEVLCGSSGVYFVVVRKAGAERSRRIPLPDGRGPVLVVLCEPSMLVPASPAIKCVQAVVSAGYRALSTG
ncbi:hypothetical protein K470DRAFT_160726 [Piedraia hortae CBS 480.64]|uniref:Uncharacterized protein n=1 Tax=Piedraia hortae CBS 480.64 TaxID=1314780 RepID=A0A6A7BR60_9PEZI|nr:hypothetical protein K470DRAFT_160726 [Piedraia hortae CBS 480.64]